MNVPTIRMRRDVARRELAKYATTRRKDVRGEIAAARQMLEALAEGTPVLLLSEVFGADCPRDEKLRPRFAIARSDRTFVHFTHEQWTGVYRFDSTTPGYRDCRDGVLSVSSALSREWRERDKGQTAREGYALVPMVPPDVARGHDLAHRFTLWDVDAWSDRRLGARPDRDPFLLARLAPDCFAVVGQWDLTPAERAVMQGRTQPLSR